MASGRGGITPQGRGRYPGFDVLEEVDHWDEATRRVALARVEEVPPIRFFERPATLKLIVPGSRSGMVGIITNNVRTRALCFHPLERVPNEGSVTKALPTLPRSPA